MLQPRGRLVAALAAVVAATSLTFAVAALGSRGGDDGKAGNDNRGAEAKRGSDNGRHVGRDVLRSSLVPSLPADAAIHGVAPGTVPWVLDRGSVRLRGDGRLRLRVEGLVIPPPAGTNTAGGVTSITASLFCGAGTTPTATSTAVPLTSAGDARIDQRLTFTGACLAPVVFVHPNGGAARFIAVSGFGR
jgi:hypothetical protein